MNTEIEILNRFIAEQQALSVDVVLDKLTETVTAEDITRGAEFGENKITKSGSWHEKNRNAVSEKVKSDFGNGLIAEITGIRAYRKNLSALLV